MKDNALKLFKDAYSNNSNIKNKIDINKYDLSGRIEYKKAMDFAEYENIKDVNHLCDTNNKRYRRNTGYIHLSIPECETEFYGYSLSGKNISRSLKTNKLTLIKPLDKLILEPFTVGHSREYDTECKILNYIASKFHTNLINYKSHILLYTYFGCCESCMSIVTQFLLEYPLSKISILYDKEYK